MCGLSSNKLISQYIKYIRAVATHIYISNYYFLKQSRMPVKIIIMILIKVELQKIGMVQLQR
jgi:hypothetical protein